MKATVFVREPEADASAWPRRFLGAGLVLLLLAYANTLQVPFLLDDTATLGDNPSITRLADWRAVLNPPPWSFSAGRPLLNLSFALNHWFGGGDVVGYHLVNLGLHLANVGLLWGLAGRLLRRTGGTGSEWIPAAAAVLWGLHPLQTASVTYLSQRAEVMMATCWLAGVYAFVRAWDSRWPAGWRTLSVAAVAAGVLVKEVAATAPVACWLLERAYLGGSWRDVGRRRWRVWAGFSAAWLLLAWVMLRSDLAGRLALPETSRISLAYAALQLRAFGEYLSLPFWPHLLVFDRGTSEAALAGYPAGKGVLLLVAAAAGIFFAWRWTPRAALPGVLFFLLLAPTSSVVPVWGQPIAENRLYLPLAAVVLVLLLGLARWVRPGAARTVAVALAVGWAGLTAARNAEFASAERIWRDTVAKAPANHRAEGNLALALLGDPARWEEAVRHLEAARRLAPDDPTNHYQLGRAHALREGGETEAMRHFRECLRRQPSHALAHSQLALLLIRTGQPAAALPHIEEAVRLRPDRADLRVMLGGLLQDVPGRQGEAVRWLEQAVREVPGDSMAWMNLGNALLNAGQPRDRALAAYREACRVAPGNHLAWYNLGLALLAGGDPAAAVEGKASLEQALRLVPGFEPARRQLERVGGAGPR